MLHLDAIPAAVAATLQQEQQRVAEIFERQLASDLSAVNRLCLHVEKYRGKMLRPALVLLSGMAASGDSGDGSRVRASHRVLAAVVEMIHMATLVHDDVLDESDMRRGGATVNHLWGNEAAVMLGDYLISNAFHLCSTIGEPSINLALGEVTNTLCAGELMQLHHRDDYGLDEAVYFEIIRRKTASLISACCRLGAVLSEADASVTEPLARYGASLGVAFQVRDDLLDLVGDTAIVGKTLGLDLVKGKLTLPLIHHVARCEAAQRAEILRDLEAADAVSLRSRLEASGAIAATQAAAERHAADAAEALRSLPAGAARDLLEHFTQAVVSRSF